MKIILTIILFFQIYFAFGQSINVKTIEISLDIKELIKPASNVELTHAVKCKDDFYCFFEDFKRDIKYCFFFSNKGDNLKKIEVPAEIQNSMDYDIFVKNDKVFVKTYTDSSTLYFDSEKSKWRKTMNADDLIFEDEKFYVYSLDFDAWGWGGKTWFKDKKTGLEYEIEITKPLINKIDSTYYLTTSFEVLKIKNPLTLNKCDNDVTYEYIKKYANFGDWFGEPIGFEIEYKDTTRRFSYQPHIVSSFVSQNELFHIYETETVTYLAKVDNNSIKTIQNIGNKLSFDDWKYSYRSKILTDGRQLLKFKTNNKFGLMEINGQDINTYYLIMQ